MKKTIAILCAMMLAMCAFIPALADDLGKEVAAGAVNGVITGATVSQFIFFKKLKKQAELYASYNIL